jgi:hypothetical protein
MMKREEEREPTSGKTGSDYICPACGERMEHGFLVSMRGLSWCKDVPVFSCRCGERLASAFFGCSSLEGYRCAKCRIVRYAKRE